MESALRDCCLGIKIGKILVQRQSYNGEITGHSDSLPPLSVPELSAQMVRLLLHSVALFERVWQGPV